MQDSYNVSGIVDNGVGLITITWDVDFATTNYTVAATNYIPNGTSAGILSTIEAIAVGSTSFHNNGLSGSLSDPLAFYCIAIGDQ